MIFTDTKPARAGFWLVVLLGVFAWAPAAYPGYWQGLEGFIPVFNAAQPAPVAGIASQADLWRGAGSATFLLTQPLLLLGWTPTAAVRTVFALSFILGGLGVYVWLRPHFGDRGAGLAGFLYMLLPPVLATTYVRGSLSDALVLGLLPMALAAIGTFAAHRSPATAAIFVIALLWIWRAQAGLAVFVTLMLLLYVVLVERDRLLLLTVAVSAIAALASLIPLWSITAPPAAPFAEHFLAPFQLFASGWSVAPSIAGWQDRYPFQLGLAAVGFGLVALWLCWRPGERTLAPASRRLLLFSAGAAAAAVLLSLAPSASLWRLTGAERLLTYPWQVLLPVMPLLAVGAGSLPALNRSFGEPSWWSVLLALTLLSSSGTLTTVFTPLAPPEAPLATFGEEPAVALLAAELAPDAPPGHVRLDAAWQVLRPLTFDYNVFFQALTGDEPPHVLAQLDVQPLADGRPATAWQPGEILYASYVLDLTGAAQPLDPADLLYYFGFYNWQDGRRLPVDGGRDDKLVLNER